MRKTNAKPKLAHKGKGRNTNDTEKKTWARITFLTQVYKIFCEQQKASARGKFLAAKRVYKVTHAMRVKDPQDMALARLHFANVKTLREAWGKYVHWWYRADGAVWQIARARRKYSKALDGITVLDLPIYQVLDGRAKLNPPKGTTHILADEYVQRQPNVTVAYVQGLALRTTSLTNLRYSSIRTVMATMGQYANKMALIGHQLAPIESLGLSTLSPLLFWQIGEAHRRLLAKAKKGKKASMPRAVYDAEFGYPRTAKKALAVLGEIQALMGDSATYWMAQFESVSSAIGAGDIPAQLGIGDIYRFSEIQRVTGTDPKTISQAQVAMRAYRNEAKQAIQAPVKKAKKGKGKKGKGKDKTPKPYQYPVPRALPTAPGLTYGQALRAPAPAPKTPKALIPLEGPYVPHIQAPSIPTPDGEGMGVWVSAFVGPYPSQIVHARPHVNTIIGGQYVQALGSNLISGYNPSPYPDCPVPSDSGSCVDTWDD